MNVEQVFKILENKTWHFMKSGYQHLTMGTGYGTLMIRFQKHGRLEFPSQMKFLPKWNRWSWDEEKQQLKLLDGELTEIVFGKPEFNDKKIIIKDLSSKDTLETNPFIDQNIRQQIANDPLMKSVNKVSVNKLSLIITTKQMDQKNFNILNSCGYQSVCIEGEVNSKQFWTAVYELLMKYKNLNQVFIINNEIDVNYILSHSISLKNNVKIIEHHNLFKGLLGCRSIIIQIICEALNLSNLKQLNAENISFDLIIRDVLKRYFSRQTELNNLR